MKCNCIVSEALISSDPLFRRLIVQGTPKVLAFAHSAAIGELVAALRRQR